MKVPQTIAASVGSVLFLGLMALSTGLALAERGDEGGQADHRDDHGGHGR
ncbi:MAG: hypothetical protein HXY51_16215 [Nitrospirae bacterium]|nr:hypothetical protein [Nitrospirota bacterium]